jgi:thiopeptide-type bacteriocin biosynthesis protein
MSARGPGGPVDGAAVTPSGFFVLRTPLLPFTEVAAWGEGLQAPAAVADASLLPEAVAADRLQLRRRLEGIVTTPEFCDALFVASPSLADAVEMWRKEPDSDKGRAVERSLVSYFLRAAARPTPFGLFAGYTTGSIGPRTRLRLDGLAGYRRHTRLDMDYLWALADAVERDPRLRGDLRYRPNSSLYQIGDRLLFAEARPGRADGTGRSYRLVAVGATPYLMQTLARARDGARLGALAAALVDDEITLADAEGYLAELAGSQVLVADVRPQLTGGTPASTLVAALNRHEVTAGIGRRVQEAADCLAAIDAEGVGVPAERYRAAAAILRGLPVSPELSRFAQVDLAKPAAGVTLGTQVTADLLRGAEILHDLSRYRPHEGLSQFREQFTRRYETREVPLAQALDEENGIGFERSGSLAAEAAGTAPLLAGLPLGLSGGTREESVPWTRRDTFLLGKLTRALAAGRREITIEAAEAAAVRAVGIPPLPDAFEVAAAIVAEAGQVPGDDAQVLLHSVSGPPGARVLGRFCHADAELEQLVRAHLADEEAAHPERVFAEVVHQPEGRIGNILVRPVLRAYEIPYLGGSGAPVDRQLPLADLLVSVQGERIVLRSGRLGREVIPRLTTAHNYIGRGLGIYRFLCALQVQDVIPGLMWDWGPLGGAPFLPRVVSGRVILSRARWNIGERELAAFRGPRGAGQFAAVQRLRERCRMPRFVALVNGENDLLADLDNVLSVEMLGHEVKGQPSAVLAEMLPGPSQLCASGPEGPFTHQIIVPFIRSAPQPRNPQPGNPQPAAPSCPRRFPPGSEWLYIKLYTGTATADQVLHHLARAVEPSIADGRADRWFFVRYADPDWHLRLRVHGAPERLLTETLPQLHRAAVPLLETGQLWRVQLDTYEREVERYGGEAGIGLAERAFHADSDATAKIVRQLTGDAGADLRWRVALRGIDMLFDDLGLTLEQKQAIARGARRGYGREFGAGGDFQQAVGRRYRTERAGIAALLDPHLDPPEELAASLGALRQRSVVLAPVGQELRASSAAGRLTAQVPELAMSLAHMHVNRLLPSAQRAQELVLYELLGRAYDAHAARRPR